MGKDYEKELLLANTKRKRAREELIDAIVKGEESRVRAYLAEGRGEFVMYGEESPYALAIVNGTLTPGMKAIFDEFEVNINLPDSQGNSPLLHLASSKVFTPALLEAFFDAGADIGAVNNYGETALSIAAGSLFLSREEVSFTPLLIKTFARLGGDVNIPDLEQGDTALHTYARYSSRIENDMLDAFEEAGADLLAVNKDGDTPMSIALYSHGLERKVSNICVYLKRGTEAEKMYPGWTPQKFLKKLGDECFLSNNELAVLVMTVALAMEESGQDTPPTLSLSVTGQAGDTRPCGPSVSVQGNNPLVNYLATDPEFPDYFLHFLSEGRGKNYSAPEFEYATFVRLVTRIEKTLSPSSHLEWREIAKPLLVEFLTSLVDEESGLETVLEFLRNSPAGAVSKWSREGVRGASELAARIASYLSEGREVLPGESSPGNDIIVQF